MGIPTTWEDIHNGVGEGVGRTVRETGQIIAEKACFLTTKYANKFPVVPYTRGFVSGICEPTPTPYVPPEAAFQGGQCEGVQYEVTMVATTSFNSQPRPDKTVTLTLYGPLTDLGVSRPIPGNDPRIIGFFVNGFDIQGNEAFAVDPIGGVGWNAVLTSTTISRVDGLADDCGDPGEGFPPDPPLNEPDFSSTVTINRYNDAGDIIETNNFTLQFNSDDDNLFDTTVNLGGTTIAIDIGGISIGEGGTGESPTIKRIPDSPSCSPTQTPFNPEDYTTDEIEEEEDEKEYEDRLAWVSVDIGTLPVKGSTIVQQDPKNNDYFAGYLVFTVKTDDGTFDLPAQQVKKLASIFKAPIGATGFKKYAVNGATLSAKAYLEKVEVEN